MTTVLFVGVAGTAVPGGPELPKDELADDIYAGEEDELRPAAPAEVSGPPHTPGHQTTAHTVTVCRTDADIYTPRSYAMQLRWHGMPCTVGCAVMSLSHLNNMLLACSCTAATCCDSTGGLLERAHTHLVTPCRPIFLCSEPLVGARDSKNIACCHEDVASHTLCACLGTFLGPFADSAASAATQPHHSAVAGGTAAAAAAAIGPLLPVGC